MKPTTSVTHTRQVPHTVLGRTRMIPDEYTVDVPALPRDWDHLVLNTVTGVTGVLLLATVAWTTASVGDLLAGAVFVYIAYLAALVFDLVWISCMLLEWLARFDATRARVPARAGNVALAVAMGAVCAHGWLKGNVAVGVVGALVSCLVKGLWTIVMRHQAIRLDARTQAWLAQEDSELGVELALHARRRQHARAEHKLAALRTALALPGPESGQNRTGPDSRPLVPVAVRAAVSAAISTVPDATPDQLAAQLTAVGFSIDADTVRTVLAELEDEPDAGDEEVVLAFPGGGKPSLTDTVKAVLDSGTRNRDAVRSAVRAVHPTADIPTIDRLIRRHTPKQGTAS